MSHNPPQIFIAHANEDKPLVRELYDKLVKAGYKPWLDEEGLLRGQNWREEIPKALKNSDLFLACLSSTSISKRGYIQREFKMAMEMLAELPPGEIYLIPLKFDDCEIPELRQSEYGLNLRDIQWLDYWKPNGFETLIKAIEDQFGSQGRDVEESTPLNQEGLQSSILQENQGSGDNVAGNKTVNNYYLSSQRHVTNHDNHDYPEALELWREKLAVFRREDDIEHHNPLRKLQQIWGIPVLLLLSLLPPIQDLLLEPRLLVQAFYRHLTYQIPSQVESPLLLVKIDNQSLVQDEIEQRHPIDYSYLAKLVEKASNLDAKVIGIDYILDQTEHQPNETKNLADAINQAEGIKFIFATMNSEDPFEGSISEDIVKLDNNWYQQGNIQFYQWYMEIPDRRNHSISSPFAYQLALNYACYLNQSNKNFETNRDTLADPCSILSGGNQITRFLISLNILSISHFFQWFQPIIDFSIPPDKAYQTISACELLGTCQPLENQEKNWNSKLILIAPGGYEKAGVEEKNEDNYTTPLAINYWQGWSKKNFTGGEAHAQMIHHFLTERLVISVPDFLMTLLSVSIRLIVIKNSQNIKKILIISGVATIIYGWIGLQLFVSAAILIPWLLPSLAFWLTLYYASQKKRSS